MEHGARLEQFADVQPHPSVGTPDLLSCSDSCMFTLDH